MATISDELKRRIKCCVEENQESIFANTARLMEFKSVAENTSEIAGALDFVLSLADRMGMRTGVTKGHDVGWVEIGAGVETVGILVHVDVVGIGDPDKWSVPPFAMTVKNDMAYGRGIVDDKGPVMMSLYAMKSMLDLNIPLKKKLRLIVGTSEEGVWTDIANYKEEFGEPEYGFSPDGDFPIYNIEKGYCDVHLFFSEPHIAELKEVKAGDSPNTIPSKAVLHIAGHKPVQFNGTSAHSSTPWLGDNAILKLAAPAAEGGYMFARFIMDFFADDCHGIKLGVDDGSDMINGTLVGPTVVSPTMLNLNDGSVMLNVNIRVRPGVNVAAIRAAFDQHIEKYCYRYVITDSSEPMMVSPSLPFLKEMNDLYVAYGYEGKFLSAPGATYASIMRNCVSWGPIFPDEYSCAHMEDEQVLIPSMLRATRLYAEFLVVTAS